MNPDLLEHFFAGDAYEADRLFGAHFHDGGCRFTVYAPCARSVSLIGSFNEWREEPLERIDDRGIYQIDCPEVREWDVYRYRITGADGRITDKSDPYAFYSETRPATASKAVLLDKHIWRDQAWMSSRCVGYDKPVSIYEVYAGSWKRPDGRDFSYTEMKNELIPYVKKTGFTHIEFMPLSEYPYDGSWGYQVSGYFSLTSRYGNPQEFMELVDACHQNGIGVLMDFVPVHFVKDSFGLAKFDGQPLYEYPDARDAESEWGTLNFNTGRNEVRSFLLSAASFWLRTYHIDGIRMDAVSRMIYRGGSSDRGINEESVRFLKQLNQTLKKTDPSVILIAEDSSAYPGVTARTEEGGLGFDYKWDLGWMNDTLDYFATDPLYRIYHHHQLTFSMAYFYSEKFLLPLSHDENVHSKKTIADRMWGSYDQKFSQTRTLYAYMYSHPGKKLNFMGNEIAVFREFDEKKEPDWFLLSYPRHDAFQCFFRELNALYRNHPALSRYDYTYDGFRWIDADNAVQSVYSYYRESEEELIVCVMNLSVFEYDQFTLRVPKAGIYRQILNTEDTRFDGSGFGMEQKVRAKRKQGDRQFGFEIEAALPKLGMVWFVHRKRRPEGDRHV